MVCRIVAVLISMTLVVSMAAPQAYAQGTAEQIVGKNSGTRKQMATIIFSGLAGAVLGLSTLSFYGRPQDKLQNIAVAAAVGIIIGASYTTYKTATTPRNYTSLSPEAWTIASRTEKKSSAPGFGVQFEF